MPDPPESQESAAWHLKCYNRHWKSSHEKQMYKDAFQTLLATIAGISDQQLMFMIDDARRCPLVDGEPPAILVRPLGLVRSAMYFVVSVLFSVTPLKAVRGRFSGLGSDVTLLILHTGSIKTVVFVRSRSGTRGVVRRCSEGLLQTNVPSDLEHPYGNRAGKSNDAWSARPCSH
jgi:hypothetical protein